MLSLTMGPKKILVGDEIAEDIKQFVNGKTERINVEDRRGLSADPWD